MRRQADEKGNPTSMGRIGRRQGCLGRKNQLLDRVASKLGGMRQVCGLDWVGCGKTLGTGGSEGMACAR